MTKNKPLVIFPWTKDEQLKAKVLGLVSYYDHVDARHDISDGTKQSWKLKAWMDRWKTDYI